MRSGSSNKPNRLIHENSPYLLQHAYNPVDWYPWGKEAFQTARQKNIPVFLSIGYSTCHWCHVMEEESFEDPKIADMMNRTFICIKVDREERPDIDSMYMKICQQMTERCGWPMTVIMTPGKVPFFISTYVPKKSGLAGIGMADLIPQIAEIWKTRQDEIVNKTEEIKQRLNRITAAPEGAEYISPKDVIQKGYHLLAHYYDQNYGGFGRAPKFPAPHNIMFLLRHWNYTGNTDALKMAETTLTSMQLGGIFDHVGYGFHRYSTDEKWKLPHFEKMLNDQALLALAYTEAYQATGKKVYENTARKILRYVLRDMRSEKGGFYSAEDADSEGVEGKFYLWTEDEIRYILTPEEADLVCRVFNVKREGNFAEESTGKLTGNNILYMKGETSEIVEPTEKENEEIQKLLNQALDKLYEVRSARVHPLKDDKILTDWNGLMIAALAKASGAFQEPEYVEYAKTCTKFILDNMYDGSGKLLHRYHRENAGIDGFVDDYAAFVWGLIELYEATFEEKYLQKALEINDYFISHFQDEKGRGFYFTSNDRSGDLIVRSMEICDTSMPSGNSMAVLNILRLAKMTGDHNLESVASEAIRHLAAAISHNPISSTYLLSAFYFASEPGCEVVIAAEIDNAKDMIEALQTNFIPQCVYLLRPADSSESFTETIGYLKEMKGINGRPAAYVCRNYTCSSPVTDAVEMMDLIEYGKKNH